MDSVSLLKNHVTSALPAVVRPHQLREFIQHYHTNFKVLSLDCFDTLIWRSVATPIDVFYDLQSSPVFKKYGITARVRRQAESLARDRKKLRNHSSEVTLTEIYRDGIDGLTSDDINELVSEELAIESKLCTAFQPVVELINIAKSCGLKVVIVSDTYFSVQQLKTLLALKLPNETLDAIDAIFCSCEYGRSKVNGLFQDVSARLGIDPSKILHIGDNPLSDVSGANKYGVIPCRLVAHSNEAAELLRMQNIASSFVDPTIRNERSIPNLYHALIAQNEKAKSDASFYLGYVTLGPILYAFGRYLLELTKKLTSEGKRIRPVFLMRDAYLPYKVCETIENESVGHLVRISRFSAYAASFRSVDDVENYLSTRMSAGHFEDYCRQLLLSEDLTAKILHQANNSDEPNAVFHAEIIKPAVVEQIISASSLYAERLIRHLKQTVDIQPNETIMFVDLGYTGTAQLKLEPILKSSLGVDVIGCYLISLTSGPASINHYGLLNSKKYDDNFLVMLVSYIALLEQLCTTAESSVVNYDENGFPVYTTVSMRDEQNSKLLSVQANCLQFIKDLHQENIDKPDQPDFEKIRDAAAMNLTRLLFLPTKIEVDYLSAFHFDFNMGSDDVVSLIDTTAGLDGLRKRGWLYSSKECSDKMRTNFSAEWRAAGMDLALTLMLQHRYHLEFALSDISHRKEKLSINVFQSGVKSTIPIDASPTYDGYFSLSIPIVHAAAVIGVQFGTLYHWVEVASAELIDIAHYNTAYESKSARIADPYFSLYELLPKQGGLYECVTPDSMLLFDPARDRNPAGSILRLIFRPTVKRMTTASEA